MQALASRVLRAIGALLIVLGLVHLAATPHIPHLLDGCPPEVLGHADGPTVLNHVLVGILPLTPTGVQVHEVAAVAPMWREPAGIEAAVPKAAWVAVVGGRF